MGVFGYGDGKNEREKNGMVADVRAEIVVPVRRASTRTPGKLS